MVTTTQLHKPGSMKIAWLQQPKCNSMYYGMLRRPYLHICATAADQQVMYDLQ